MQDEEVSRNMFWKSSNDIKDTEEFVEYELKMLENNNWDISYNLAKNTGARDT